MPELAESVVEGEILKWLVSEGDHITADQAVVEVMTDKITTELPSPFAGVLERISAPAGSIVKVHQVLAVFADLEPSRTVAQVEVPITLREERSIIETGTNGNKESEALTATFGTNTLTLNRSKAVATISTTPSQPLAVPAARKLARESKLEISQVVGSGPNGRIRLEDVRSHLNQISHKSESSSSRESVPLLGIPPVQYRTPAGYESLETRVPLRGLRRAISRQMLASHLYTVRTLTVDELDMTNLIAVRERLKPIAADKGAKLSYLPFMFKAVAVGLKDFPSLNSSLDEATQEIVLKRYCNLGLAVSTDAGLIVPVVRDVTQKSILEIAREINTLGERARDGKLEPHELTGSSFSVTNIGPLGSLFSFPIINVPDAAILGIHSIKKRAVVIETPDPENEGESIDEIVVRQMMYVSLSFDHRIVDGAEAAQFCRYVIQLLEQPERLLLEGI
jgi:2-oxoisovalerate dehydrogenase E2 component (dihydrolipoyl transacylase)